MLLMVPAGTEAGLHIHTHHHHAINIQGTWVLTVEGDAAPKELPTGSYVFQPEGQLHNDRCKGPEDCVLFIHQHGSADMLPPHTEH